MLASSKDRVGQRWTVAYENTRSQIWRPYEKLQRFANPALHHYLWKTDLKINFQPGIGWCVTAAKLRFQSLSWTRVEQIWYPIISPLKWRQDQQLPSLWDWWWNVWFGRRLTVPWQPGNIFIRDNIVVFFLPPLPPLFVATACVYLHSRLAACVSVRCACCVRSLVFLCVRCHADQTNLWRRDVCVKPDPVFAGEVKQAAMLSDGESDLRLRWKGAECCSASLSCPNHTRRGLRVGQQGRDTLGYGASVSLFHLWKIGFHFINFIPLNV